jgi:2-oxoisovalerate dehydrogenase E2 component (dihydrolipoyl transacylase)
VPEFLLPDLGEGLTEAEIITWRVAVGDIVTIDQHVVDVETAKAVVEVPIPFAGRVSRLHGDPGDVLDVGRPLITVDAPAVADGAPADDDASGNVLIGYGTSGGRQRRRRHAAASQPVMAAATAPAGPIRPTVVSPLVRRLARESGIDIAAVAGSGPGGLIVRRDVDAAIAGATAPRATERVEQVIATGDERIPLRGVRKVIAEKLVRSRREIPEATVWVDVDATELLAARRALNADSTATKISVLALLARFTVLGLTRFPELNASVDGDDLVLHRAIHLGFAAQTPRGLVVPVVAEAQARTLEQLSADLSERTEQARAGTLPPQRVLGGTFTINNYGVFGVDGSAAIINHPEAAILGLGRIIPRPWVVDGQIVPRMMTQLTLAFDHRVCDGGIAGGFLRYVADCLEAPASALRHL